MATTGIASIGLQLPSLYLPVTELAALRGVDPNKFTVGLGCSDIALCAEDESVVTLAAGAARRALSRWSGSIDDIGLIAVGTETAQDMSRPLSAFVADELGISGQVRSYEVKHACYGGTLALRQALEWAWSGANRGKAALVIAADVALYDEADPGEPTQGAGAVAMIIASPDVAAVDVDTCAFSSPAFDFWRPVGHAHPSVDGELSLRCYKEATEECFAGLIGRRGSSASLDEFDAIAFHVPFPKMVRKAFGHLGEANGWDAAIVDELYASKVQPTMEWNRNCGNAYTASLWISVASALGGLAQGRRVAAFSYGSGFGAELFGITAGSKAAEFAWKADFDADIRARKAIDRETYVALRARLRGE